MVVGSVLALALGLGGFQASVGGREKAVVLDVRRHQSEREGEREGGREAGPLSRESKSNLTSARGGGGGGGGVSEKKVPSFLPSILPLSTLGIEIGFYSSATRPVNFIR